MERAEYVELCKVRAREYLKANDLGNAVASMLSDMDKQEDTKVNSFLAMVGILSITNNDREGVKRFIEGFN